MIVIHGSTPLELLKAAMLCKIYNCPALPRKQVSGSLFTGEVVSGENLNFFEVTQSFEKKLGPVSWLATGKLKNLLAAGYYAIRFNAEDRFQVVVSAFTQALEKGPDFVISRVSKEARLMYNRSRQVYGEAHRAYGFVRLTPLMTAAGEIMVGQVEFQHLISDLVLKHFIRRSKGTPVYLIEQNQAYHYHQGSFMITPVHELPFTIPSNEFADMWDAYYDSQYIKERKNLALARKNLPKKCWSWVPEGKKLT